MRLEPIYDGAKSFYGKANVFTSYDNGNVVMELISYTTLVAKIEDGRAYVKGSYSRTTTRHIKEFLLQNGLILKILRTYWINTIGIDIKNILIIRYYIVFILSVKEF